VLTAVEAEVATSSLVDVVDDVIVVVRASPVLGSNPKPVIWV
jgi:hypothetical protein